MSILLLEEDETYETSLLVPDLVLIACVVNALFASISLRRKKWRRSHTGRDVSMDQTANGVQRLLARRVLSRKGV